MYEVEAKATLPDPERARAELRRQGAEWLGVETEEDAYFAHPARDFAATDEALRLRVAARPGEGDGRPGPASARAVRVELTYKGPKLDARTKTREERTVPLPGEAAAAEMGVVLDRLGFRRVATVRKLRETWRWGVAVVCLDEVPGLGAFVEVEWTAASEEEARALAEEALALLARLGGGAPIRASYLELLLAASAEGAPGKGPG